MAEENDQNAVQPQNDEQQTVPMPPVDAEQTQTYAGEPYAAESATEPIDVQGGIEDQPTAAMPVANDGASAESAAAARSKNSVKFPAPAGLLFPSLKCGPEKTAFRPASENPSSGFLFFKAYFGCL